ncbi:MAG: isoprenyl transferase [Clostridia bacterium]|nr:isoprenyl transferase [Clostridia bacterium]
MDKENLPQFSVLPRHVGIIMDGNGRWAQKRGLPRYKGHIEGAKTFRKIGEFAGDLGIECLTFYAFSTENWKRPPEEVAAIMDLFREYLRELDERKAENEEKGIKVNFIGDRHGIPKDILKMMGYSERITRKKDHVILNIAINYGGRQEILHSVQALAKEVEKGKLKAADITEDMISDHLYTGGLPDPDLIIRPSGEYRLSNFLLWQSAYSEFWYSDILWPDFTEEDFTAALREFEKRNRRFGGV